VARAEYRETLYRPHEIMPVGRRRHDRPDRGDRRIFGIPLRMCASCATRRSGAARGRPLRAGIAVRRYPLLFYTSCDRQYAPED